MLGSLTAAIVLLTAADHWTTYLCLRGDVPGWLVYEANPVAAWLFSSVGLVPGLLVDTAITVGALVFVHRSAQLPRGFKTACLALLAATTAWAVNNNLDAVWVLGVPLAG